VIYRYRIREADGSEAGEAHYAVLIQPGETIHASDGRKLRVVNGVAVDRCDRLEVVRYDVVSGVAGGSFVRGTVLASVQDDLAAAGVEDVSFEIVSGVLVGVGFVVEAESIEDAERLACEVMWATSLERVGLPAVSEQTRQLV
jgi:hypothetical protein